MAASKNPRKPMPQDPSVAEPALTEPALTEPVVTDPVVAGPDSAPDLAPTTSGPTPLPPEAPDHTEPAEQSDPGVGGKAKAAALLAGAAALANKVRQEAPKKVREIRQKRVAGRYVLVTGAPREVAVGPYPDEEAARQDLVNFAEVPRVVELLSQPAYHGPGQSGDTGD